MTSYFYKVRKVKVLKKLINMPSYCDLLENLGKDKLLKDDVLEDAKEFISTVSIQERTTRHIFRVEFVYTKI